MIAEFKITWCASCVRLCRARKILFKAKRHWYIDFPFFLPFSKIQPQLVQIETIQFVILFLLKGSRIHKIFN